jgi:hypothetical protein
VVTIATRITPTKGDKTMEDSIFDEAERIGLNQAGAYIKRFSRYPMKDDVDHWLQAWQAAWHDLRQRGANCGLHDKCLEAWRVGFLGTEA